ncbi:MAG: monovalent cation/H(+) antiporter subunit G [Bacteroidota bacterium]
MNDIIIAVLILTGVFFILVAAIGLIRLPDLLTRIHAATKATSFGLLFIMAGLAVHFGSWIIVVKALLLVMFIYLTAPLAASVIARSAESEEEPEQES